MRKTQAGLAFIFITLLIDVIGFGLVIPVLPSLVKGLAHGSERHGVEMFGWLLAVYGLMQFLCAPILGNLSDRFGRRPVLLLALLFTGFDYVIQALAPNVEWLFVGRILAGMMGASFTAATAYIADITPPEKRAQNFGMVGAAFGVGFIIGPAIGGLLGNMGDRVPFWAAAIASTLNFLYGLFVLPESLPKEKRRPFQTNNLNPFIALSILGRKPWVLYLALTAGLLWLAQQVPPSAWVLYTDYRFHWGKIENGWSMALIGVCSMVVQLWLIRVLSAKYGDVGLLTIALIFNTIGFILLGGVPTPSLMLVSMCIWSVCFVGGPAIQSLVSKEFGENEQGAAQGALTAIQSLTGILGPVLYANVFGYFTAPKAPVHIPGSPFFLGAIITVVAGVLARYAFTHRPSLAAAKA